MIRPFFCHHAFALVPVWLALVCAPLGAELTEREFQQLYEQLQPDPERPWRTIAWKIDLLDAQRTAATRNQPLFIWAMDGHPLGCT